MMSLFVPYDAARRARRDGMEASGALPINLSDVHRSKILFDRTMKITG